MNTDTDRLVHWLVSSLELDTSVFHVGQYCGSWRASTAGRARASFHLVLRGRCFLHLDGGAAPLQLEDGDAVFLLRDRPHSLTPERQPGPACVPRPMGPMQPIEPDGTSLACGFFDFRGLTGAFLVESFPDLLVLRAGSGGLRAVTPVFDLIRAEADRDAEPPSPLIGRLTELLLFYLIREVASQERIGAGLWAVAARPRFAPLLHQLLGHPERDWSVDDMARLANMSRASFFKHFVDASGQPPAQFLLALRMNIAARHLRDGESVTRAAERVGYQSPAAFTRAFHKVLGEQPGAYQRARRQAPATTPALREMH
ncbi:MAG TPA: AraC family transcriptional regulator [Rubrivivax sp.]|uniref:AraC family transcriptional regulator n=1 Tax=Thauera sp. 27 TaxID=305700 RepID=UPI0002D018B4|nr:AraC family transcriptional regulator [Thauera sp. 27]ENO78737.1 AraC family transcriptional regulator [Thauera sp. 27]HNU12354.1 AraC family transcriptional regulator [Rubrivivax sp.]